LLDALEPFRIEGVEQSPEPLSYLKNENFTYNIELEVYLKTEKNSELFKITHSNFKYLYWNIAQQLAHHTVTGCNLRTGDLLASGTISGPEKSSRGCLLELTWRGTEPLILPNGEKRTFLLDGDEIIIKGFCRGDGYRVGFGEVTGKILP
jgi:fumarylacetoacetase